MIVSVIVFLIGLVFGSFLNVLIYRLPLGISLLKPIGSACPHCNYKIKWYENIPVFSYLFLKGRCSSCSGSISIVYPLAWACHHILHSKHQSKNYPKQGTRKSKSSRWGWHAYCWGYWWPSGGSARHYGDLSGCSSSLVTGNL